MIDTNADPFAAPADGDAASIVMCERRVLAEALVGMVPVYARESVAEIGPHRFTHGRRWLAELVAGGADLAAVRAESRGRAWMRGELTLTLDSVRLPGLVALYVTDLARVHRRQDLRGLALTLHRIASDGSQHEVDAALGLAGVVHAIEANGAPRVAEEVRNAA